MVGFVGWKGAVKAWERRKIAVMGGRGHAHQGELDLLIVCLRISSFSQTTHLLRKN